MELKNVFSLSGLYSFLKEKKHKKMLKNMRPYYKIEDDTQLMSDFDISCINPIKGKQYLKIGHNCIIKSPFLFESQQGEVIIGNNCYIGGSAFISHCRIEVGDNVTIAWGGTIYDHDSHSLDFMERRKDVSDELDDMKNGRFFIINKDWNIVNTKPIKICNDAWIGMNCIILKGVTIGEGAIIGAGSVVTHDIPAWTVAAGNPAKVVKKIEK
jgi:acetyltransferase-like isoleucine patch superfamily enzyme